MWRIRIKGPNKLNKVLSVRKLVPFTEMDLFNHQYQYAIDNQINPNALILEQFQEDAKA